MRTRPDCAIKGEIAVKKAPIRIARRLRSSGSDSPARKPQTRPDLREFGELFDRVFAERMNVRLALIAKTLPPVAA